MLTVDVMSVVSDWKMKTALISPPPSRKRAVVPVMVIADA
jgi:hypothetical protein